MLRQSEGTICSKCYACKGHYLYENVAYAHQRRLEGLAHPDWVKAMVTLIRASKSKFFRWFDSGDLQSAEHFSKIWEIARQLPDVKFWMPTMEYRWVRRYWDALPANLTIRVSSPKIGKSRKARRFPISFVEPCRSDDDWKKHVKNNNRPASIIHFCPSSIQKGHCGDCRACWDKKKQFVIYRQH